jgi:GH35 family endo-1,4-beta-xylanase
MNALILLLATVPWAAPISEAEILDGADARIQQHRTGELVIRLLDAGGKPVAPGTPARIEQTRHAFLFGCNIFKLGRCASPEDNAAYEKYYAELLNFATLPFYWWGYETQQGVVNDDRTREIIRWCEAHDVTMKGHPLAWNYRDPRWLPDDLETAFLAQMYRIVRCTREFRDHIQIWDVVNEATHYNRPECIKAAPILTRVIREKGVGPYLRSAFKAARLGNPEATLIINDYRTEEGYAAKVLDELVDDEGKPLYDVIGIQSHQHGGAWPVAKIWEVCERFAGRGKPLHFTETTFLSGQPGWNLKAQSQDPDFVWASTPEGEQRQAEQASRFYTVLFSHPAVEAITWWDFTDQNSWQSAPSGLLRRDMTPKPAYDALKRLIRQEWWTTTSAPVEDDGAIRFRGFYGQYRVSVGEGDGAKQATFAFDRTTTGPIEVKLK